MCLRSIVNNAMMGIRDKQFGQKGLDIKKCRFWEEKFILRVVHRGKEKKGRDERGREERDRQTETDRQTDNDRLRQIDGQTGRQRQRHSGG